MHKTNMEMDLYDVNMNMKRTWQGCGVRLCLNLCLTD
jgi:hypothetical protein